MTEEELKAKLALLDLDEDQEKAMVCVLVGHSRIQTTCFSYFYCGRCGDQVGDQLGSIYPEAKEAVIVGHDCPTCRENFEECTWEDKFMCADPFPVVQVTA